MNVLNNTLLNQLVSRGITPLKGENQPAGRLVHYLENWKILTKDQWVLNTVQGYQLELLEEPTQRVAPHPPQYSVEQSKLIEEEVSALLEKEAVSKVGQPNEGFYSNLFLVPKRDGGQRPVINLKALNQFLQPQHFKMEGIHTLRDIIKPGDWLAKVDLKDAFFTIPIHQSHRKFLRSSFRGEAYQFNCLPFGLSSAPWVFTKTLKPVVALLRELGVRMVVYIDDILILAETKEALTNQVEALVYLLEAVGFIINQKKSITTPTQSLEFLGVTIDTRSMTISLPAGKLKKIRAEARKMALAVSVSARDLARLLGKMNATASVIPVAPLFCRHLQRSLSQALNDNAQSYDTQVTLSPESREELVWWDTHMKDWNGKTLLRRQIDLTIDSDASLTGWGAACQDQRTGGPWSLEERQMHINCLELLAATLAIQTFAKHKTDISVLLRIDNTTAVAYINNLGGTISKDLLELAKNLWMWCLKKNIHITAQHLPGILNEVADTESRVMIDRSDWKLNPAIFRRINQVMGPVQIDLFASRLTTQCQRYFSWRPDPYAEATDAFLQDWSQVKGYANPPWNLVGRVLAHVQSQQAQVVLVAPVWKTQPWYPLLLSMLVQFPFLINQGPEVIVHQPQPVLDTQLAVWNISGRDTESRSFRRTLPRSCSSLGEPRLTGRTTHCSQSGIAGVVNGTQIPFLAL